MSYFNAISQNVLSSVSNNSSTPLTTGSTFTGTGESTLSVAGIQLNFIGDQDCTIYVDQSMDPPAAGHWDITNTVNYIASKGGLGRTFQATASYFRVRVKNTSPVNMTYLRLQVALCPIVEAVPQSLSPNGHFDVGVYEIQDAASGNSVGISNANEMRVCKHVRLAGAAIAGSTFDGNFWVTTPTNGGSATQANGEMTLATNGASNGAINVISSRIGRFVSGVPNYYRGMLNVPAKVGVGTNVKRWGAFTATDGFFFSTDGTTLSVTCRKASSDANTVASGSFNGQYGSTYVLDTGVHIWEMFYTPIKTLFYIDGQLLHTFTGTTTTLSGTLHLPAAMENINSGGGTDLNTLVVRLASVARLGEPVTRPRWQNWTAAQAALVLKYGPGTLHRVTLNKGAGTLLTLYDSVNTGSPTNPICAVTLSGGSVTAPASFAYDVDFVTGLLIVITGTPDLTIVWE